MIRLSRKLLVSLRILIACSNLCCLLSVLLNIGNDLYLLFISDLGVSNLSTVFIGGNPYSCCGEIVMASIGYNIVILSHWLFDCVWILCGRGPEQGATVVERLVRGLYMIDSISDLGEARITNFVCI